MKILKIILFIIAGIIILFFTIGTFLPASYSVSKSIAINAPDSIIYKNIADFHNFNKWNPWLKIEPNTPMTYNGEPLTTGHSCEWNGKKTGEGIMTLTDSEPNKTVNIDLKFIRPMENLAFMNFVIEPDGNANKLTWTMSGECNSVIEKWMGVMTKIIMKSDFDKGLNELKSLSESSK